MTSQINAFIVSALLAASVPVLAQHPAMPPGMTHDEHLAQMKKDAELKKRGALAMGFDQEKTTHHFLLSPTGGAIDVAANDAADDTSRTHIRAHLREIAAEFARGDFDKPFATHREVPPGVRTMKERVKMLAFAYEETANGGRVRISTPDAKARAAVHEFLRYQIREHGTGDSLVSPKALF